jgi:hypothetical protein
MNIIPTNFNDLDKQLLFMENNNIFDNFNFHKCFAYYILHNEINLISKLNIFIREHNIIIKPDNIYKNMAIISVNEEMEELEKYYGDNVCINYDIKKNTLIMKNKYIKLFNF